MVFPTFNPPQLRNFAQPESAVNTPFMSLDGNAISAKVPLRSSLITRIFQNLRQSVLRQFSAPKSPAARRPTFAKASHSTRLRPTPPASLVTQPFGASGSTLPPGLRTPNPKERDSDTDTDEEPLKEVNDTTKPTCSLNLVSYRDGCAVRQIRVISQERFGGQTPGYKTTISQNPGLIKTDEELFLALRKVYFHDMCGFWRRWFSLKTLRRLRLLSYTKNSRPEPVLFDELTMQEVLWAYNHPSSFGSETEWIEWVFRLRQSDKRHCLEFLEGWNPTRIAIFGTIPCVASTLVGVTWSAMGGDAQTAFTVAGFILTVTTVLLALLAVISAIDSSQPVRP